MEAAFIAIGAAILCSIICASMGAFFPSEKQVAEAREKRMAQHRMNARLLRFNI